MSSRAGELCGRSRRVKYICACSSTVGFQPMNASRLHEKTKHEIPWAATRERIEEMTFRLLLEEVTQSMETIRALESPLVAKFTVDVAEACQAQDKRRLAGVCIEMHQHVGILRDGVRRRRETHRETILGWVGVGVGLVAVIAYLIGFQIVKQYASSN